MIIVFGLCLCVLVAVVFVCLYIDLRVDLAWLIVECYDYCFCIYYYVFDMYDSFDCLV